MKTYVKRSSLENYFLFYTNKPKKFFPDWKITKTFSVLFHTFQDCVGTLV